MKRFDLTRLALIAGVIGLFAGGAQAQELAITFDDLPAHSALPPGETRLEVAQEIIAALKAAHAPPTYGFVNGVRIEQEPASEPVLTAWRAAGYLLGDHSWSHMNLSANTVEAFEADVLRNTPLLAQRMAGRDWRWFRYPFLAEGETSEKRTTIRTFLAARGYRVAAVTMSFGDYAWNEPYARCRATGDQAAIAELETRYLHAADESIDYYRGLSKTLLGRDIPYVLLMHIGAFDARMAPRLLALYRARGFKLTTLDEAERDPFYRSSIDLTLPVGPDNLEESMAARGLPLPPRRSDEAWLAALCLPASPQR
jgi:peptidoglycan/xylan/chitin deacetylase (PgdA/CDA1 family)